MVSDTLTSLIIIGGVGILYALGSSMWEEVTETVDQIEDSPGINTFGMSYTCEHCGHTITHWIQDPMWTNKLHCPQCGGVLQDQQAAATAAHAYFEEEGDEW